MVKWSLVQKPKNLGGLGVRDIVIKNTTLFFKWWWRFAKEDYPFWKQIICSCNKLQLDRPINSQLVCQKGGPWFSICSLPINDEAVGSVIRNGIVFDIGDGTKTFF